MSDDIVEKVAAVIYAQCGSMDETYDDDLNALAPHDRVNWYRIARAAITAYEAAATDHIEIGKPSPIYVIPVQGTWSQSGFKPLPDINRIRELEEALRAADAAYETEPDARLLELEARVSVIETNRDARIRELEEALRPFAIVAEYIDTHCPDAPDSDETGIGIGKLRRAHAVLIKKTALPRRIARHVF